MKRTNSFVLFGRAFKNAKNDFWVSIQVLLVATFVLALLFYFVEHTAQPEEYKNPWDAFVWAITRYIGDPGKFAGKGPVTLTGRYIDTFIGILKILIFAVPAGLVANGFRQAMADDKRKRHLEECRIKIRKSFRRILNKKTQYRVIPRRMPIITLQAKKGMNEKDIIDTVTKYDEFCLRNLATSQTAAEHPQDRLVIEMLPLDLQTVDGFDIVRTSYGIIINRNSNVTIIAPTAATENSIGHFAYYLAQFGGFNYVSREFITDVDEPVSYYTIDGKENEWELPLKDFVNDINEGECLLELNEQINHYLSPWNEGGLTQFFGCTLDKERLLMFIQSLPYVEAVQDFSVLRISSKDHTDYHMEETGENNTNQIRGTYPWSILTPMKKHFINVVTKVEEFRDITIGYGDLEVGSTFIIQRRNNG